MVRNYFCASLFFLSMLLTKSALGTPIVETKLECQIEIRSEYFSNLTAGTSRETKKEVATVIITEYGKNLTVTVEGTEPIITVMTGNTFGHLKSYYNQSTENVWQLSNELNYKGGGEGSNDLRIDRNTGLLTFLRTSSSKTSTIKENGTGYCSKVDTTKKKF